MFDSVTDGHHPEAIIMWKEDEFWIIKHENSGVTTQGESRVEALKMLSEALSLHIEHSGE